MYYRDKFHINDIIIVSCGWLTWCIILPSQ